MNFLQLVLIDKDYLDSWIKTFEELLEDDDLNYCITKLVFHYVFSKKYG